VREEEFVLSIGRLLLLLEEEEDSKILYERG
jgi:hypothetical protein